MIIEIIIIIFLLFSLVGVILFTKHFFKHKRHVQRRKTERIIKRVVSGDKYKESFTEWFVDKLLKNATKITFFCMVLVFINVVFQPFAQNTETTPTPNTNEPAMNNSMNNSITEIFASSFADGKVPWWFYTLIFGIPMWMAWRFIRGSRYDYL